MVFTHGQYYQNPWFTTRKERTRWQDYGFEDFLQPSLQRIKKNRSAMKQNGFFSCRQRDSASSMEQK